MRSSCPTTGSSDVVFAGRATPPSLGFVDEPSEYLTPAEVVGVEFETRRRGIDPAAVDVHLRSVAESMRSLISDNETLRSELGDLRRTHEQAQSARDALAGLTDEELAERVGEEAARIVADAHAEAAALVDQADTDARRIRAEAESVFEERSIAADEEVARRRTAAGEELGEQRAEAEAEAAQLVSEAEIVRRQILEDLARRRSMARRQIEQLRAGRDRLLSSHETVRRVLDELSQELTVSMAEARAAAESAGHSVPETTIDDLEAEIETARLSGLLDTGPVPVVESPPPEAADGDPVEVDSSVADLFARMRRTQQKVDSSASRGGDEDSRSRTNDSLRQR